MKVTLHITHFRAPAFHLLATFIIYFWLPAATSLKYKQSHSVRTEGNSCTGDVTTRLECSEAARTLGKRGSFSFVVS